MMRRWMGRSRDVPAVVHVGPPMHPNEVAQTGRILAAARRHGVQHLIYYSVMHPLRREVRHHRLKLDAEEAVIEGGVPYTILQPMRYMQHLEPIWNAVRTTGIHAMPFNVDIGFTVVDLADLAEVTAGVVLDPAHLYATYELAGPQTPEPARHGRYPQRGTGARRGRPASPPR